MTFRACGILGGILLLGASVVEAQQRARPYLDLSVGLAHTSGGEWVDRDATYVNGMIGVSRQILTHVALNSGLTLGKTLDHDRVLLCRVRAAGGCVPPLPVFSFVGIFAGAELTSDWFGISVTIGPSAVHGRKVFSTFDPPSSVRFGVQSGITAQIKFPKYVSLGYSGLFVYVPRYAGDVLQTRGHGVGFRLQ